MTYDKAIKILEFSPDQTLEKNAEKAKYRLKHLALRSPLRYAVACRVIIDAALPQKPQNA